MDAVSTGTVPHYELPVYHLGSADLQRGTMTSDKKALEKSRRDLLFAAGGLVGAIAGTPPAASAQGIGAGFVEEMRGRASAELSGLKRLLDVNAQVFVGDTVLTEDHARLMLRLGSATIIKLGERTRLQIDKYLAETGGVLDLVSGSIQFEHRGPQLRQGLDLRSVYGLIAVRGTRFYAAPTEKGFSVLVGSGLLEVTAGGRTVRVGPQKGTDIPNLGAPPSEPAGWSLPRIRRMQALFS
jgi:hypothetical protein